MRNASRGLAFPRITGNNAPARMAAGCAHSCRPVFGHFNDGYGENIVFICLLTLIFTALRVGCVCPASTRREAPFAPPRITDNSAAAHISVRHAFCRAVSRRMARIFLDCRLTPRFSARHSECVCSASACRDAFASHASRAVMRRHTVA
jgi:hypothetical protein